METNLYAVKFVVLYIWLGKIFCSQKRKWRSHYSMAQPSLFSPYFDFNDAVSYIASHP